ncbi:MAG: hypothetical protein CMK32_07335 [Porticoccaceae bacterium]|nr:hypothetical protein [Porticoccaceae bacterium]
MCAILQKVLLFIDCQGPDAMDTPSRPRLSCTLLPFALLAFFASSEAATVYKSVDADGNIAYSDRPPANYQQVEVIDIPEAPPATVPSSEELIKSLSNTTERLRADRLAREAERTPPTREYDYQGPPEERAEYRDDDWRYYAPYRDPYRYYHRRNHRNLQGETYRRDAPDNPWYVPKRLPVFED